MSDINIQFPPNPENGMIFEIIPGVYYKYSSGSNCWTKLKGVDTLGLATPLVDGLMSKEDFTKLQNLIIPPPQTTLKGEECNTTFKSGTVALYSIDDSLEISKNPKVINQTPLGQVDATGPWQLHKNTAGYDFKLPLDRVVQEIEARDQLKKVKLQGQQGHKGPRGEAGEDRLDTGPVGSVGPAGINSPFDGTLVVESIPFETTQGSNRAVVNISTEELSEDENYLVVTRANVGNPDACPALVTPKDFQSALIVALNTLEGGKLIKNQSIAAGGDCSLICRVCASSIHHLNVEDLVCEVYDQFVVRVNRLKMEKEAVVKSWLATMVNLFNEQKAALCCALENCRSRKRNEGTRQYIETQRIQAALGNFSVLIDGSGENRQVTNMDAHKNCPVQTETVPSIVRQDECIFYNLDSKIHIADPRINAAQAVTTFLPAGTYIAEITGCCADFNSGANSQYSARAAVLYQAAISVGEGTAEEISIGTSVLSFPNFGTFNNESAAKNAYLGVTVSFEHAGGDISMWLIDPDGFVANNEGIVTIKVGPPPEVTDITAEAAIGFLYVYRDEISFDGLLGRVSPFVGAITAQDNFGNNPSKVQLVNGPALLEDRAQIFFYEGSDGLSLFFVAGDSNPNTQSASLLVNVDISNNTFMTVERASDTETNVRQISASQYQAASTIEGDSAGFAIGEFDNNAEYSIRVDPQDLSTMRTFVAADANGDDIIISEGGSEGISGNIAVTQINSAPLFSIAGVPTQFGGGNQTGMRVNNESSGQNVILTRPIVLDVSATVGGVDNQIIINESPVEPIEGSVFEHIETSFNNADWTNTVFTSGRDGSISNTVRRVNPIFRETEHISVDEKRRLVETQRPGEIYLGPNSNPALPWNQSFAIDQFDNKWIFIRDIIGRPGTSGVNNIFFRDARADEIPHYYAGLDAETIFGEESGIQHLTIASGDSVSIVPAKIATFHIQNNISFTPGINSGPIQTINMDVQGNVVDAGPFDVGVTVLQDDILYASTQAVSFTTIESQTKSVNVGALGFGIIDDDGVIDVSFNPDFNGSKIFMGYYVKSTHIHADIKTIGINNWRINVIAESIPFGEDEIEVDGVLVPTEVIDEKGGFVGEAASGQVRGTTGSPQDPCIVDISATIRTAAPQSIRYVLTDDEGVKYYSAFRSIDINLLGDYQFFSFGMAISVLAPPPEFTQEVIFGKNIAVSVIEDQLSAAQVKVAESLGGIARLSYIQEILGKTTDKVPNSRKITDLEIESRGMAFSSIDLGVVTAFVGVPGSTTEVLIDNFEIQTTVVGQTVAEPERITGAIKRVVATKSGSDSSTTGLIYAGLDNYFGDYDGFDTFTKRDVGFVGNNFFVFNRAGQKVSQITKARGFKDLKYLSGASADTPVQTTSRNVAFDDPIAVNPFGVVYIADGPAGKLHAIMAANASILNTTYGDANDESANILVTVAQGLPTTSNASVVLSRTLQAGPNTVDEVLMNFGNQWFTVNGPQATLLRNGSAARENVTTPRCCFGGNPPGGARVITLNSGAVGHTGVGSGPVGNSITTDRNANPQLSHPVPGSQMNQGIVDAIQSELDRDFNQFNIFSLEDGTIYKINRSSGARTVHKELGENGFGLRAHPRTKHLYYITNDRGTNPKSGTAIRRVDTSLNVRTVYVADEDEGIFGITFANSVPTDSTTKNQVLYALLSTLNNPDEGRTITARLVEIAERTVPAVPSQPISEETPLNSIWESFVTGGRLLGNPTRVIFSRLTPGGGCQMHYKQVQWYERGWRIGACCGALVEVSGMHYLVIKRSIGTDTSCGGGESLSNACINQFIDVGEGHPAIAWPTIALDGPPPGGGGEEFLGLPTSGFVNFVKDAALSNQILDVINTGNAIRTIGDPTEIPFILFPAA